MAEKLTKYILMITGIILLFYFGGLINPETSILTILLSPENITTTTLWITAVVSIVSIGVAIAVTIISRDLRLAAYASYVPILFSFLWNFIEVFNVVRAENFVLAVLIFSPLFILLSVTAVEFWGVGTA